MMMALLAQIEAIASHTVEPIDDGKAYRVGELLTIRRTLADALAEVDKYLNWRVKERRARQGRKPDPHNGEYYAIESPGVEYIGNKEVVTSVDYAVVHMSRSGDSAGYHGGYKSLAAAEAAALREARRRNCIFIPRGGT